MTWTMERPPPPNDKDALDLAVAIWISGFGGGLLIAEVLRSVL